MMNVKILVCCHKQDVMATESPYMPIHVGKAISKVELGIQGDDTGNNISSKNQSYCECTGMYWAWKNFKKVDVIGLCHYRRYFDFHHQCKWPLSIEAFKTEHFSQMDLSIPDDIIRKVVNGSVVIAKPLIYPMPLIYDYAYCHVSEDIRIIETIIRETTDRQYSEAFNVVMRHNGKLSHFNMFLMSWKDFDAYCSWLFPILEEGERRIDISNYNPVQRRIWGYLAERLFNVWLYAEHKHTIKKPVIWMNDKASNLSRFHVMFIKIRRSLSYRFIGFSLNRKD